MPSGMPLISPYFLHGMPLVSPCFFCNIPFNIRAYPVYQQIA